MEVVYKVYISKVCSRSLIGYVYRMFQRQIPDREGLQLGVVWSHAHPGFVIHLVKAGCKLAAAWSRCIDHHHRSFHRNVFILSIPFWRHHKIDV